MPLTLQFMATLALATLVFIHATILAVAVKRACNAADVDDTLPSVFAFAGILWLPMVAFLLWQRFAPPAASVPYLQRAALSGAAVTLLAAALWTVVLHRAIRAPDLTRRMLRILLITAPTAILAAALAVMASPMNPTGTPNQPLAIVAFLAMTISGGVWLAWTIRTLNAWSVRTTRTLGHRCPDCGYDLTGLAREVTRCPECGAAR